MLLPLSSFTVKVTVGVCPADRIRHAGDGEIDAGHQRIRVLRVRSGGVGGHTCAPMNGGIEGRLALSDMAVVALGVVGLESAGVVGAGGEVDVVMAGAAGGAAGLGHKGLACAAPVVWLWQTSQRCGIGGIDHRRKVVDGIHVADNLIRASGSCRCQPRWATGSPCGFYEPSL